MYLMIKVEILCREFKTKLNNVIKCHGTFRESLYLIRDTPSVSRWSGRGLRKRRWNPEVWAVVGWTRLKLSITFVRWDAEFLFNLLKRYL